MEELTPEQVSEFVNPPVRVTPSKPMPLSSEMREVAELLATKGMTVQRVSEVTGVPISAIKKWKKNPEFTQHMQNFVLDIAEGLRAWRLMMCMKTLDARVEKIEEIGDWSLFSQKDSMDIMAEMRKDTEKQEEKEQTQYMKVMEALIIKSATKNIVNIADGGTQLCHS